MSEAIKNTKTGEFICPCCGMDYFIVFGKDKLSEDSYLHHCKCLDCNQLFVFKSKEETFKKIAKGDFLASGMKPSELKNEGLMPFR